MRYNEFKTSEGIENFMSTLLGTSSAGMVNDIADKLSGKTDGGKPDAENPDGTIQYKSAPGAVDPNQMKAYLKSKHGLDNNQIAGLLVNAKWESHFKPGAYVASDNKQGPSGGLFGFHDPGFNGKGNFSSMIKFCGGKDQWQTNWQGQLDFALQSGPGTQYKSLKFSTPAQAASWWVINYEKPADTQGQAVARGKEAHRFA